jgi:hypothetical protein
MISNSPGIKRENQIRRGYGQENTPTSASHFEDPFRLRGKIDIAHMAKPRVIDALERNGPVTGAHGIQSEKHRSEDKGIKLETVLWMGRVQDAGPSQFVKEANTAPEDDDNRQMWIARRWVPDLPWDRRLHQVEQ